MSRWAEGQAEYEKNVPFHASDDLQEHREVREADHTVRGLLQCTFRLEFTYQVVLIIHWSYGYISTQSINLASPDGHTSPRN